MLNEPSITTEPTGDFRVNRWVTGGMDGVSCLSDRSHERP